jgi:hypothetical protein
VRGRESGREKGGIQRKRIGRRRHERSVTSTPRTCLGERERERERESRERQGQTRRQRGGASVSRKHARSAITNAKDLLG